MGHRGQFVQKYCKWKVWHISMIRDEVECQDRTVTYGRWNQSKEIGVMWGRSCDSKVREGNLVCTLYRLTKSHEYAISRFQQRWTKTFLGKAAKSIANVFTPCDPCLMWYISLRLWSTLWRQNKAETFEDTEISIMSIVQAGHENKAQ